MWVICILLESLILNIVVDQTLTIVKCSTGSAAFGLVCWYPSVLKTWWKYFTEYKYAIFRSTGKKTIKCSLKRSQNSVVRREKENDVILGSSTPINTCSTNKKCFYFKRGNYFKIKLSWQENNIISKWTFAQEEGYNWNTLSADTASWNTWTMLIKKKCKFKKAHTGGLF